MSFSNPAAAPGVSINLDGAGFDTDTGHVGPFAWSPTGSQVSAPLDILPVVDASSSAGNVPTLRIGDPAAGHMRVDNNELIVMSNDTTKDVLIINEGCRISAEGRISGPNVGGSPFAVATGNVSLTPPAGGGTVSVDVTFPAGRFTAVPSVTATANTTVPSVASVGVMNVTTAGFTLYLSRTNGTVTSAGWIAVNT